MVFEYSGQGALSGHSPVRCLLGVMKSNATMLVPRGRAKPRTRCPWKVPSPCRPPERSQQG